MTKDDDLVKRLRLGACALEIEQAADRIEALEAKLAKAVQALSEAWFMLTVPHIDYEPEPEEPGLRRIKTTLAELNGEKR